MILQPEYTELERVTEIPEEDDIYFIAFKDGQAGILKNRKQILDYQYEDIEYNAENDVFILQRNSKKGMINREGKTILSTEYDNILFGGMYIDAQKGDNLYLFDFAGNSIEKKQYISKTKTDNPKYYIVVDENDIYSVVDENDNIIIENNYTYIEYLPGDYFIVAKDGKNGVVNSTGKSVIDLNYTSIFKLNNTKNIIQAEIVEDNKKTTIELYNMDMHKIIGMRDAYISILDNYILLSSENDFAYLDFNGNRLNSNELFKENTLFAKKMNNKWGFVDKDGKMVVENQYEMVTDFNKYGYAGIKQNGKWGVIEQNTKKIIVEPIYDLDWQQPSFLGKYYRIQTWSNDEKYSDDIEEKD